MPLEGTHSDCPHGQDIEYGEPLKSWTRNTEQIRADKSLTLWNLWLNLVHPIITAPTRHIDCALPDNQTRNTGVNNNTNSTHTLIPR